MKSVLVLAGLDPSGGAGLLADAEAIRASGVKPLCVPTALTVQTTARARRFEPVSTALVIEMARALLEEEDVRAIKIGMLGTAALAEAVRELVRGKPVVLDPVLAASSGASLFEGPLDALLSLMQGAVVTPNVAEAATLLGRSLPQEEAARALVARGARACVLKGGHLDGDATDVLVDADGHALAFSAPRLDVQARGTGCRFASALAAGLALGEPLGDATLAAKAAVRAYLQDAARFEKTERSG